MARHLLFRRAMLLAAAGLSGCTLIDQRTFDPAAGMAPVHPKPPPPPLPSAPPQPGAPPLLSIRLPTSQDLPLMVGRAVAAARKRKKDVVFDVVEITPGTSAGSEAADIARLIVAQGVSDQRVHLSAQPVPGVAREVRVFVH